MPKENLGCLTAATRTDNHFPPAYRPTQQGKPTTQPGKILTSKESHHKHDDPRPAEANGGLDAGQNRECHRGRHGS